jgi:hypothetical protein
MHNEVQEKISVGSEGISYTRLLWAALLAVLLAAVTNAQVYFAASGLGIVSRGVLLPSPMGLSPLTVGMVVTASVVGAIGAALVFAIIGLLARRPVRLFRIVAAVVLVLSLVPPTTIPSVPPSDEDNARGDARGDVGGERRAANRAGPPESERVKEEK